jgi:hypothetical protein
MQENQMPLDFLAYSDPLGQIARGLPLLIGSDPSATSPSPEAALAWADVIFCEEHPSSDILSLAAPGALVELVPAGGDHTALRALSISRARTLAHDGWRVVWVAPRGSADLAADFGYIAVGHGAIDDGGTTAARTPHVLATAFNGLAG